MGRAHCDNFWVVLKFLRSIRPMHSSCVFSGASANLALRMHSQPACWNLWEVDVRPPIVGWFGENLTLSPEVRQTSFAMRPPCFSIKRIYLVARTIEGTLPSERPSQDGRERSLRTNRLLQKPDWKDTKPPGIWNKLCALKNKTFCRLKNWRI